jgi:hypothetical protein
VEARLDLGRERAVVQVALAQEVVVQAEVAAAAGAGAAKPMLRAAVSAA